MYALAGGETSSPECRSSCVLSGIHLLLFLIPLCSKSKMDPGLRCAKPGRRKRLSTPNGFRVRFLPDPDPVPGMTAKKNRNKVPVLPSTLVSESSGQWRLVARWRWRRTCTIFTWRKATTRSPGTEGPKFRQPGRLVSCFLRYAFEKARRTLFLLSQDRSPDRIPFASLR